MRERFIFSIGGATVSVGGVIIARREDLWCGVEIESDDPVDLEEFAGEFGYELVPVAKVAPSELVSLGVDRFPVLVMQVDHPASSRPLIDERVNSHIPREN